MINSILSLQVHIDFGVEERNKKLLYCWNEFLKIGRIEADIRGISSMVYGETKIIVI